MPQTSATVEPKLVCLVLTSPEGKSVSQSLEPDASLIVGSDARCGMQLECGSISPRHCTVRCVSGQIVLTDWFSEFGTFVNGRRLSEETRIDPDDEVRLGECTLKIIIRDVNPSVNGKPASLDPTFSAPQPLETAVSLAQWNDDGADCPVESAGDRSPSDSRDGAPSTARLQIELAQALEEIEFLKQELEAQLAEPVSAAKTIELGEDCHSPELELLRAQNVQLQMELAERDAALHSGWSQDDGLCDPLSGGQAGGTGDPDEASEADGADEADALVERLEMMLDELKAADRRVATMDDLLRSSAEEHRLEIEEREQLANWVGEIEQRFAEREETWRAERSLLESKLNELNTQRKQEVAEFNATVASQSDDRTGKMLAELQRKYERALDQLEAQQTELNQLRRAANDHRDAAEKAKRVRDLESMLRQRDVEISQERAAMARQRADMDRVRVESERSPRSLNKADENDIRIQAFRDHLRGIHEQELNRKKELKSRSLATRLSQLWQRLDGG